MKPPPSWGFKLFEKPSEMTSQAKPTPYNSVVSGVKPKKIHQLPSLKLTFSHVKQDGWNTTCLLRRPIFRGYVSFREGTVSTPLPVVFLHVVCQKIENTNMGKHKLYKLPSLNQKTNTQDVSKPKKFHLFLFFGLQKFRTPPWLKGFWKHR